MPSCDTCPSVSHKSLVSERYPWNMFPEWTGYVRGSPDDCICIHHILNDSRCDAGTMTRQQLLLLFTQALQDLQHGQSQKMGE